MKYKVNDVYTYNPSTTDGSRKVMAVCGELVGLSRFDRHEQFGDWYSLSHMNKDYTLKTDTPQVKKTVSELEKSLGMDAGTLNVVAEYRRL